MLPHDKQCKRDNENVLEISGKRDTDSASEGPGIPRWGNNWVQHWGIRSISWDMQGENTKGGRQHGQREFWRYMPYSGKTEEVTVGRMAEQEARKGVDNYALKIGYQQLLSYCL